MINRFNNLTVARFVAALLVYLHHSLPDEYTTLHYAFLQRVFNNGYVGVSFFFIVSGFVLAASNLDRLGELTIRHTLSFYWKRIARIVPLWLVVSSPFIVSAVHFHSHALLPFLTFTQAWSSDINITFGLLAVAWTLSVEMFFYASFPFFAALLRWLPGKSTGPWLIVAGLGIPAVGMIYFLAHPQLAVLDGTSPLSPHRWLYRFPVARLGEFLAGIGVYLTVRRGVIRAGAAWLFVGLGVFTFALFEVMGHLTPGGAFWVFPYAVLFTGIVLFLAALETRGHAITAKTPILLGEASFAFYLIHQAYMKSLLYPAMATVSVNQRVSQAFVLLLTIAVSVGLFLLVETPSREALLRLVKVRSTLPTPVVVDDENEPSSESAPFGETVEAKT